MMKIDSTQFGSINVDGETYAHYVVVRLSGKIKKKKKKLSKKMFGTSHMMSLPEAEFVYEKGSDLLVLGTGFAAQGLAIVHWTADERRWPRVWPLVLYAPLLLGAPWAGLLLLGLALAGIADNGFALRRRRSDGV